MHDHAHSVHHRHATKEHSLGYTHGGGLLSPPECPYPLYPLTSKFPHYYQYIHPTLYTPTHSPSHTPKKLIPNPHAAHYPTLIFTIEASRTTSPTHHGLISQWLGPLITPITSSTRTHRKPTMTTRIPRPPTQSYPLANYLKILKHVSLHGPNTAHGIHNPPHPTPKITTPGSLLPLNKPHQYRNPLSPTALTSLPTFV